MFGREAMRYRYEIKMISRLRILPTLEAEQTFVPLM